MRRGERKRVPYENPQGRRLNVLALTTQEADAEALYWMPSRRHLDSDDLLHFLRALPPAPVPTVVVLDNAGLHRSKDVRAAMAEREQELRAGTGLDAPLPTGDQVQLPARRGSHSAG